MAASSRRKSFYADLDRLKHHFDALDPQKSGYIGYAELTQLVQSMRGQEESVVPELMERLDRDKDGKVDCLLLFTCFVVASGCICLYYATPPLRVAFEVIVQVGAVCWHYLIQKYSVVTSDDVHVAYRVAECLALLAL